MTRLATPPVIASAVPWMCSLYRDPLYYSVSYRVIDGDP